MEISANKKEVFGYQVHSQMCVYPSLDFYVYH